MSVRKPHSKFLGVVKLGAHTVEINIVVTDAVHLIEFHIAPNQYISMQASRSAPTETYFILHSQSFSKSFI